LVFPWGTARPPHRPRQGLTSPRPGQANGKCGVTATHRLPPSGPSPTRTFTPSSWLIFISRNSNRRAAAGQELVQRRGSELCGPACRHRGSKQRRGSEMCGHTWHGSLALTPHPTQLAKQMLRSSRNVRLPNRGGGGVSRPVQATGWKVVPSAGVIVRGDHFPTLTVHVAKRLQLIERCAVTVNRA
jgi:hypothetical protein